MRIDMDELEKELEETLYPLIDEIRSLSVCVKHDDFFVAVLKQVSVATAKILAKHMPIQGGPPVIFEGALGDIVEQVCSKCDKPTYAWMSISEGDKTYYICTSCLLETFGLKQPDGAHAWDEKKEEWNPPL
jgi:hypothetical protein